MTSKSIKKNYALNLSYQVFALLAPLITAPYVSRVLGPGGIGSYSFAESIASYFVLVAVLGTSTYGQREVSYRQDDRAERTRLFWNIAALRALTTLVVLVAYVLFALFQDEPMLYLVLGMGILSVGVDFTWLFQGVEDFQIVVLRNFAIRIVSIVLIFALVRNRGDLVLYAAILAGGPLAGNLALWPKLKAYIGRPEIRSLRPFSDIRGVISLFVPALAISIYTVLDKTMIGVITSDAAQNGYYEQAVKMSKLGLAVVASLVNVVAPRIGHLYSQGKLDEMLSYMYKSYRFVWLIGIPVCFGLVAVAPSFVPWFFGEEFMPSIPVMQIMSFLVLAIGINSVTGVQYMLPTGEQNLYTASVVIGALVNFALNLVLIPLQGALGAAVASITAETAIALVQFYFVRNTISFSRVVKSSWKYVISGAIMLACLMLLGKTLEATVLSTLLLIAVGALLYSCTLLALRDQLSLDLARGFINRLKRR